MLLPGCGGCRSSSQSANQTDADKDKDKNATDGDKAKPDFEMMSLKSLPTEDEQTFNYAKPGHWTTSIQPMRANNFDFQAEWKTTAVDREGQGLVIENTPFYLTASRPAALPKGQLKHLETICFFPRVWSGRQRQVFVESDLRARSGGRQLASEQQGMTPMPDFQYHMVVLSAQPDRYGFLKRLDSVAPPFASLLEVQPMTFYRVSLPRLEGYVPLPSHALTWSSIAYIVWDDADPTLLTPQQQQAMLDWLHFGGQLLVSGPDSLDTLRGSFLGPHLSATSAKSLPLEQSAFNEINDNWSLFSTRQGRRLLEIVPDKPPVGVELQLTESPDAQFLPGTGKLVAESRTGRGRVVVTAFSLADRQVLNWPNYDGFFNACLLRRPSREFVKSDDGPLVSWAQYPHLLKDARLSTALRYVTRDIGSVATARDSQDAMVDELDFSQIERVVDSNSQDWEVRPRIRPSTSELNPTDNVWRFGGVHAWPQSGSAGWNDASAAAEAARGALRQAAGISVPKAEFVLWVLAGYLALLVPVNWAVFRAIGRVEWAWIAAPIIAVAGAGTVIHFAQLDIGFARSRTEVGVLELYGGYHRGHLTRYTALYTSLSSTYQVQFDEPSALAQPFTANLREERRTFDTPTPVTFRIEDAISLSGVKVASNSTSLLHCEQMYDVQGTLQLVGDDVNGYRVENHTHLLLHDVVVLRRIGGAGLYTAHVGDLPPNTDAVLRYSPGPDGADEGAWQASGDDASDGDAADGAELLDLSELRRLAVEQLALDDDEVRLIAWTADELAGFRITPRASQTIQRTFVLAHLRPPSLPVPQPDKNSRYEVVDDREDDPLDGVEEPTSTGTGP